MLGTNLSNKRNGSSSHAFPHAPAQRAKRDARTVKTQHNIAPEDVDVNLPCNGLGYAGKVTRQSESTVAEDDSDQSMSLIHTRGQARDEFPFPVQRVPQNQNEPIDQLGSNHHPDMSLSSSHRFGPHGLPTPPQSRPSVSPTCCLHHTLPSPMSTFTSPQPWSPLTPITHVTEASMNESASHSLRRLLIADDLGLSVDEFRQLEEFANMRVSGSPKRSGRVVKKKIRQRRSSARSHQSGFEEQTKISDTDTSERCEQWAREVVPASDSRDWWKDVSWSKFSDSSSDSSTSSCSEFCDAEEGPLGENDTADQHTSREYVVQGQPLKQNMLTTRSTRRPRMDYRIGTTGWKWPT